MAGQFVTAVSDAEFEKEVLQSEQPVLVDFWAAWCGPCRALAPVVDEIASHYNGQLKVMKMDVDANTSTPMRYGIRGIPALLIFKAARSPIRSLAMSPRTPSTSRSPKCSRKLSIFERIEIVRIPRLMSPAGNVSRGASCVGTLIAISSNPHPTEC
jgi:thioredoxin 1